MQTKETKEQVLHRVKDEYAKKFEYIDWTDYCVCGRIHPNDLDKIAEAYHQEMLKQMSPSDEEIKGVVISYYEKQEAYLRIQVPTAEYWVKWMRDQFLNSK